MQQKTFQKAENQSLGNVHSRSKKQEGAEFLTRLPEE